MEQNFSTWHIHLMGLVQGIGFRPFVYNVAIQHDLNGWVKNDKDGLHVEINATKQRAHEFYETITSEAPMLARITSASIEKRAFTHYTSFEISHEVDAAYSKIDLAPDFATCRNCETELVSTDNRRFQYPFITCSECGPRYSIIHHLPYDRENTKMASFQMCDACQTEYNNPSDRRYYAQTNSCPSCKIQLTLYDSNKQIVEHEAGAILGLVAKKWKEGNIVAIKGIGGYLITCDASNPKAIVTLRRRKKRPDKPLALMYPDLTLLKSFDLNDAERAMFTGSVSPILLLSKSDKKEISAGVCDGLSRVGIMMPYAPLFKLLLDEFDRPIVATSGNVSSDPIIFQDKKALDKLTEIADFVLAHNREIIVPQDDSVLTFTNFYKKKVIMRRSRGMAPSYYNPIMEFGTRSILALGALLKSTFAIQQNASVYVSQYLGDLDNYDTELNYQHTLEHYFRLLNFQPEMIVVDMHSNYASTIKGLQLSEELKVPVLKVQHHVAHFSALLGEHALIDSNEKILGVIWDGTGLGSDENIWGGEFFMYDHYQFDRCAHLPYFQNLALDKMAKEPRLSALALCYEIPEAIEMIKHKFSDVEWKVYNQILERTNKTYTSSMGRLFDAVASLLEIKDVQSYEGQAASLLQVKAEGHFSMHGLDFADSYYDSSQADPFPLKRLMAHIITDLKNLVPAVAIAAKFHLTLVHWIGHIAQQENVKRIGFSGGVFQNTLLYDLLVHHLGGHYELLFHQDLAPNDENISFGQLIYAQIAAIRAKESVN